MNLKYRYTNGRTINLILLENSVISRSGYAPLEKRPS
jgi:hypothetical protein